MVGFEKSVTVGSATQSDVVVVDFPKRVTCSLVIASSTVDLQVQTVNGGNWVNAETGKTSSEPFYLNGPVYAVRIDVTTYVDDVTLEVKAVSS